MRWTHIKTGRKKRLICIPDDDDGEKALLLRIDRWLKATTPIPCPHHHGGVPGKSVRTALMVHSCYPQRPVWFLEIDIKDYFHSIGLSLVRAGLRNTGIHPKTADGIMEASTSRLVKTPHWQNYPERMAGTPPESKIVLPQGYPTSPYLACLATAKMFNKLGVWARKKYLGFSVYFDNIIFSGRGKRDCPEAKQAYHITKHILKLNGFAISRSRLFTHHRVKLLGATMAWSSRYMLRNNQFTYSHIYPRIPRKLKRQMRAARHNLQTKVFSPEEGPRRTKELRGLDAWAISLAGMLSSEQMERIIANLTAPVVIVPTPKEDQLLAKVRKRTSFPVIAVPENQTARTCWNCVWREVWKETDACMCYVERLSAGYRYAALLPEEVMK